MPELILDHRPDTARRVGPMTSTWVFVGRSVRHSLRNPDALTIAIILPVMLMLMFTFVFGGDIDPSGHYVQYVVPGIIVLCAGFGASGTAVDVNDDLTGGIIDRFRTMPLRSRGAVTGHVVAGLARNLVATGIVIGVALAVGFRPTADVGGWLAALGIVALFILAITWLFAGIGLAARSASAASGYGFVLLFLPYLSSAFVPTDTMPAWLRGVAQDQPFTPIVDALRALLTGGSLGNEVWLAVAWCVAIFLGAYLWSGWLFSRRAGRR